MTEILEQIQALHPAVHIGVIMFIVTAVSGIAIKKINPVKLFGIGSKAGAAADKMLILHAAFLEKYIEEAIIKGLLPIVVGFICGLVKNNADMKTKLDDQLKSFAEKK